MKKFTGETHSKLSYLEFNDGQRELVAIKGIDGDKFNKIFKLVEKQVDKPITDYKRENLE